MTALRRSILRLLLGGTVVLATAGTYYGVKIAALRKLQIESARESAILQNQIRAAKEELCGIKEKEQQNWRFHSELNSLQGDAPLGPALTWFPGRMKSHLASFGVTQADIRLNTVEPARQLVGYGHTYWHVALPQQKSLRKLTDAMHAVAQLEQRDRFVKILDLTLHAETEEPGWTAGHVNLVAFVRK